MATREELHHENLKKVLRFLHEDRAAAYKDIASQTDLTLDQVKHAIDDLKHDKHLSSKWEVNYKYLGYLVNYRIDIFVTPSELREGHGGLPEDEGVSSQKELAAYILKRLPTKPQFRGKVLVEDVRILLGHPADLSATVWARDTDAILEFVLDGLRMCQAIHQTTSYNEAWSCRHEGLTA